MYRLEGRIGEDVGRSRCDDVRVKSKANCQGDVWPCLSVEPGVSDAPRTRPPADRVPWQPAEPNTGTARKTHWPGNKMGGRGCEEAEERQQLSRQDGGRLRTSARDAVVKKKKTRER